MTRLRKLFSIVIVSNLSLLSCTYLDSPNPTETIISSQFNPTSTIQITKPTQGNGSTIEAEENTRTPYYSALDFIAWTNQIKDCDPPCIWGINPGITTVEEFYEILTPHGEIYKDELADGEAKFTFFINERYSDNYLGYIEVPFIASDQIIEDVALRADLLWPSTDPTISYILNFWGEPSEIWVQIEIEPGIDWASL